MKIEITLPKLKYEMGKEPVNGFKAIEKYSDFKYIAKVKEILRTEQFKRIEDSFLGPALQFCSRNLSMYSKAMFPTSNLQKGQHMDVFLNHHWGIDAYELLLKPVKKTLENSLQKAKYPLDGFPVALHLWILEAVPKLQSAFSMIDKTGPPTAFLYVKYLHTTSPTIKAVFSIDGESDMDVVHNLPKIHGDLEDTVFLQDKDDEDLHSLVDLLEKGFRLAHDRWKRKIVKRDDALQYITSQSYRYPHSERARQNSRPPSSDESVEAKLDQLKKIFVDGHRHIRSRLSKIEQKFGIYDLSDSIDEEDISDDGDSDVSTHVHHQTGIDPMEMNDDETTESSKEQEIAQTQMEKDERSQPMEEQQTVQTPPVISTSMETVGGNEPTEMDNDDGSQEMDETTVQTPPVFTSTETVAGAGQTETNNDDGTQKKDETTVQTPPVVTSTETVAGAGQTETDNDDGSQEKNETTVQTLPVVTSTETFAGAGQIEMDNDDGSQEKDESTVVSALVAPSVAPVKGIRGASPKTYLTEGSLVKVSGDDNRCFPASVINRQSGLGPIRSYYLRYLSIDKYENVQEMRICPTPPQLLQEEHVADVLELGQLVEVYHNEHWCIGCVEAPTEGTEVSIHLYDIDKTQLVDVRETRIFRQWVYEAWDPPVDVAIQENALTSASPTTVEDIVKGKPEKEKVEKVKSKEEKGKKEKVKKKKEKKEQNEELEKTSLRRSKRCVVCKPGYKKKNNMDLNTWYQLKMDITLPKLKYEMGKEPMSGFKAIDKYSDFKYIAKVKEILGPEQFKRIGDSFFGPVLQFCSRNLSMAGKMIHTIMSKCLITKKDKKLWFHFHGHPMSFSIREFHMVTGLKCTEWLPDVEDWRMGIHLTS
ncbi:unnamed protein product [Thlaspi arvense]|uniref:DUF1985 domain-containing protein n=1 Tax=Thlaspi arvense TaxID=13288 RepID=A0AAU9T874_THLAR|nr:unnamed protein product [Thlaspi arvense]